MYATAGALRTELDVSAAVLPDDQAGRLIEDAMELVDAELGGRTVDPSSGRAVVEADVAAWQWAKLGRATVKLAALLYERPEVATDRRWRTVSGPDFMFSGGEGGPTYGALIGALLRSSGLTKLSGFRSVGMTVSGDDGLWSGAL